MSFSDLIKNSGYLHRPLRADDELFNKSSLIKELINTPVLDTLMLDLDDSLHVGCGDMQIDNQSNTVLLSAPAAFERWGENQPPDGDYCNFGFSGISVVPSISDLREYHRICFESYAEPCGVRTPHMNVGLVNDGEIKVPDTFNRTGNSIVQLYYGKWAPFIWEIGELARDNVTSISIKMSVNGYDSSVFSDYAIKIRNIRIEKVAYSEQPKGWNCSQPISYSFSGYKKDGIKTAVTQIPCKEFTLTDKKSGKTITFASKKVIYRGTELYLLDFSKILENGEYSLSVDSHSDLINISDDPFEDCKWKMLNFIYSERCGCPVPEKHGFCHSDIIAEHSVYGSDNPIKISYNGGWHDAGDVSQQTLQSGEITMALYQLASTAKNEDLRERLYEEAEWGIEFILKTRFGDGYRATSAGASRWTKGHIGDMDDIYARVHNHAFENFLLSAIEADASIHEKNRDYALSDKLYNTAYEDFKFADTRFKSHGMELPIMFEHSYNSSLSLYYAVSVYSACKLLSIAFEKEIFNTMLDYLRKLLLCQENGEKNLPISGWFYRDESHKHPVHFNHQSREHLYAFALIEAAKQLQAHDESIPERNQTEKAINLLAGYYKKLYEYSSPYGMIGAGVHFEDEVQDEDTFKLLHLITDYNSSKAEYVEQVRNGEKIGCNAYIRAFPVWFSFRGNGAVMLSSGAGIRALANHLTDYTLHQIADEQLYFFVGKNPFCQSLIYGEGKRYPAMYAALVGETIGGMPVGVETDCNEDEPFWPSANNATYKEVWTSTTARFMLTI